MQKCHWVFFSLKEKKNPPMQLLLPSSLSRYLSAWCKVISKGDTKSFKGVLEPWLLAWPVLSMLNSYFIWVSKVESALPRLCDLLFFYFIFLFICAYNVWVISPLFSHPFPYHPLRPLPLPPTSSLPSRNYFALISNFVEERI
jgi:hypothetical protein